jgi:hypothetical protein
LPANRHEVRSVRLIDVKKNTPTECSRQRARD